MIEVLPFVHDSMRIVDIVKLRGVARHLEWDYETALVVAMKLRRAKIITRAKLRDLCEWPNRDGLALRVFRLCVSSQKFRGKCSECLSLLPRKHGHAWRYCAKCRRKDATLRSKFGEIW